MYDSDNIEELTAEALQLIHDMEFTNLYDRLPTEVMPCPVPDWVLAQM